MANYTISGIVTEPDDVTPWRGYYYIGIYSDTGIALDGDGSWRAGANRLPTDPSTGAASITLPETTGDQLYSLRFESFRGETKGPWYFALTANKTWGEIIDLPMPLPDFPDWLTRAEDAADAAEASAEAAAGAAGLSRKSLTRNPDMLIIGAVTRDSNGAALSASVVWPDGTSGAYTADTLSTDFPGAVDGYHITYGSPVTSTYTQPTITRDISGAATNVPAIVVT